MSHILNEAIRRNDLRSRAVAHLEGTDAQTATRVDASSALRVLYELASSPSTAPAALALLHELQVHQVEVDLQEEELRQSRSELESALNRHVQLYDYAPVGYFTLDLQGGLREFNRKGAGLLRSDQASLHGRPLESFLTSQGAATLRAMLARVADGVATECADLELRFMPDGRTRCVHASACLDPAGGGYLIAVIAVG